jgi:hypothetical protein
MSGQKAKTNPDQLKDKSELIRLLEEVFQSLDENKDKVLQADELDWAVLDDTLDSEHAQIVAMLKANYEEIKALHKEGWFTKHNGITMADMLVFEEMLIAEKSELDEKRAKLLEMAESIRRRTRAAAHVEDHLFRHEQNPLLSIKPDAVRQGLVGDCYFLASLASVAASNPETIRRIIKENDDRTFTVTFPGDRENPVTVDAPTLVEKALYAQASGYGIWPCVLEKAYGEFLARNSRHRKIVSAENADGGGYAFEVLDILTGQFGQFDYVPYLKDEELCLKLTASFRERRAVCAGTYPEQTRFMGDSGIAAQHAFSVIEWHRENEHITLRNPWGSNSELQFETIRAHPDSGIFILSLPQFRLYFRGIYYEIWTPETGYIDSSPQPEGDNVRFTDRK